MRLQTSCWIVVFMTAAMLISCASEPVEEPTFSGEDGAAVRANLSSMFTEDPTTALDSFLSHFVEDTYWVFNQNSWDGLQGLRGVEWCATLPGTAISADHVSGAGELAFARGTYHLELNCGSDEPFEQDGTFLSVHRKGADGVWRIQAMHQSGSQSQEATDNP